MRLLRHLLVIGVFLLMPAASRASIVYFVHTGQNGAQTQIDVNHTSLWDFVPAWDWELGGGIFTMKSGLQTGEDITLTLIDISAGQAILGLVTLGPASFSQSFNAVDFFFPIPLTLTTGNSYRLQLTSPAPDVQSQAYFIKDDGVQSFVDSQGNPLPPSDPGVTTQDSPVPEPSTAAFFLGGAALLAFARWRSPRSGLNR